MAEFKQKDQQCASSTPSERDKCGSYHSLIIAKASFKQVGYGP